MPRLALLRAFALALTATANALVPASAQGVAAANWPERPIRVVLPLSPGGPNGTALRLAAEKLQVALKAADVIEKLKALDQTVVGSTPAEAAAALAADSKTWGEGARRTQLGLD